MLNIGLWEWVSFLILTVMFWVIPFWKIFKKLGYPPVLSLIMLVPVLNIAALWYIAIGEWPAKKNQFFTNQF
jgi:hypothetical protein